MRIELANEPDFALGDGITVAPSRREVRTGGQPIIVEPRVMQVLVALVRADGGVVGRDALISSCWEGRIVGDDAINRVLARLRRLADELDGAIAVETITRVGYRLVRRDGNLVEAKPEQTALSAGGIDRRRLIAGGALGALVLSAAAGWVFTHRRSKQAIDLESEAVDALDYGTLEQFGKATGALRELVQLEPDRAANWGLLAIAYASQSVNVGQPQSSQMMARAMEARQHALSLDPQEANALAVPDTFAWRRLGWLGADRQLGELHRHFPANVQIAQTLTLFLSNVGYLKEAEAVRERIDVGKRIIPFIIVGKIFRLQDTGRLDEADALIERADAALPRHLSLWFTRLRYYTHTDRFAEARAMLAPDSIKPVGVPDWNFNLAASEIDAIESREAVAIDRTMTAYREAMTHGFGFWENAIIFAVKVGLVDQAIGIANQFYLGDPQRLPKQRFSAEQGVVQDVPRRPMMFMFENRGAALRAHPGFLAIPKAMGLEAFWKERGQQPDFRAING